MATTRAKTFEFRDLGPVTSLQEFLRSFFKLRADIDNDKLWFRGQPAVEDPLLPSIGREHFYGGHSKTFSHADERQLLHRFRRRAYPHERRALNAGEALFLARHHGLPTRLLDWTANALFGLYFACLENVSFPPKTRPTKGGAVWAIRRLKRSKTIDAFELAAKRSEEDLFRPYGRKRRPATPGTPTRDAIKLLGPFFSSPRIVAQDAAFTYHSNPWRPLEDYAGVLFRGEDLDISALYRWEIPLHFKGTVVAELSGLGITHRMLFPDLDGIARSIWETEVLWGK